MKITFILPYYTVVPVGGFKVVYEYANHLSARGHDITVIHPLGPIYPYNQAPKLTAAQQVRKMLRPLRRRSALTVPWFQVSPKVKLTQVYDLFEHSIPDADAVIAPALQVAPWINEYSARKGDKYHFIQGHELWIASHEEIAAIWKLPIHKIVIAKWLADMLGDLGQGHRATHIPNGMDFSHFSLTAPIASRQLKIGMLAHHIDAKGTPDGVQALTIVRARFPDLKAVLFATTPRTSDIPDWIEFVKQPTPEALEALYNSCSLFLQSSWHEGWGLTATEAMACGCALVTTDCGGSRDYAIHGETALVTPARDPQAMADALIRLIQNDEDRQRLAQAGHDYVRQYTWERATTSMEQVLTSRVAIKTARPIHAQARKEALV